MSLKWYEYLIIAFFILSLLTVGIVFHSDVFAILNAVLGAVGIFFLAKGNIAGQFILLPQTILYIVVAFLNRFYGEVIISVLFTFPLYIVAIVSWFKNLNKSGNVGEVKVNKNLSWKEWLSLALVTSAVTVGIYFLLVHFDTNLPILSSISFFLNVMGSYLSVRRCELNFVFYIICNVVTLAMWTLVVFKDGNLTQMVVFAEYIFFVCINIFGLINWIRLKKKQGEENDRTVSTSR